MRVLYEPIVEQLERENAFRQSRNVTIQGKKGVQYVAETNVILDRPAKRKVDGKSVDVPGEPLELRLVIVQVGDVETKSLLSTSVFVEECRW